MARHRRLRVPVLSAAAIFAIGAPLLAGGSAFAAAAPDYTVLPEHVGGAAATWSITGGGDAAVVDNGDGGVLRLTAGGVSHDLRKNAYPAIDNVYTAGLLWDNVFSGAVNGQIDPATGDALETTGDAYVLARSEGGQQFWLDAVVAQGASADALSLVTLSCLLPSTTHFTWLSLNDCSTPDENLDTGWVVQDTWTYIPTDGVFNYPEHTYQPGDHTNPMRMSPRVAVLAGLGFRVTGSGSSEVGSVDVRDKTVGFRVDLPAPVPPAADTDALDQLGLTALPASSISSELGAGNTGAPLTVTIPFTSPQGDEPVAIWAFSNATLVGTATASGGVVTATINLSSLPAGPHHLLVVGQLTGHSQLYSFSVPTALAATGVDAAPWLGGAAALLVLGGSLLIVRRRQLLQR